jgi:microcystin-dependent protein
MSNPPQGVGGVALPPSGTIFMWSGLIANIPSGYVICDGNNSTPNLLAKFPRQVPTAATNPGSTGGADSVTLTTAQLPSHTHSYSTRSSSTNINPSGSEPLCSGLTSSSFDNAGSGNSHENRPAYYELAYVMKT